MPPWACTLFQILSHSYDSYIIPFKLHSSILGGPRVDYDNAIFKDWNFDSLTCRSGSQLSLRYEKSVLNSDYEDGSSLSIIFDRPDKAKKCLFWFASTKETFMLWFIMIFFCLDLKKV